MTIHSFISSTRSRTRSVMGLVVSAAVAAVPAVEALERPCQLSSSSRGLPIVSQYNPKFYSPTKKTSVVEESWGIGGRQRKS